MESKFWLIPLIIIGLRHNSCAQDKPKKWAVVTAYEASYTGTNGIIHAQYTKKQHQFEAGLNYNFSDGFSNNPVFGIGMAYGLEILTNDKWSVTAGINYRRQKPLAIVKLNARVPFGFHGNFVADEPRTNSMGN